MHNSNRNMSLRMSPGIRTESSPETLCASDIPRTRNSVRHNTDMINYCNRPSENIQHLNLSQLTTFPIMNIKSE